MGHRPRDIHDYSIWSGALHGQAVRLRETNHRIVIILRRAELLGELFHAEEPVVRRAPWIVKLLQHFMELRLVAQRQSDAQLQGLRCGKPAYSAPPALLKPPHARAASAACAPVRLKPPHAFAVLAASAPVRGPATARIRKGPWPRTVPAKRRLDSLFQIASLLGSFCVR